MLIERERLVGKYVDAIPFSIDYRVLNVCVRGRRRFGDL